MDAIKKPSEVANTLYTRKDIMFFAGLTLSDANSWPKKGIISVDQDSTGTGKDRLYTFFNVVEAALAKDLSRFFTLETVKKIMDNARDDINFDNFKLRLSDDIVFFVNDLILSGYFDFDGELITSISAPSTNIMGSNLSEICFSVHLGILAHRVFNKINNIPEEKSRDQLRKHMTCIVKGRENFHRLFDAAMNPEKVMDIFKD